ncbi:MAG: hypothetical protein IKS37_00575 [Solobacterium sp.]|nr:hypothetical protein [Solobacterium sp.]
MRKRRVSLYKFNVVLCDQCHNFYRRRPLCVEKTDVCYEAYLALKEAEETVIPVSCPVNVPYIYDENNPYEGEEVLTMTHMTIREKKDGEEMSCRLHFKRGDKYEGGLPISVGISCPYCGYDLAFGGLKMDEKGLRKGITASSILRDGIRCRIRKLRAQGDKTAINILRKELLAEMLPLEYAFRDDAREGKLDDWAVYHNTWDPADAPRHPETEEEDERKLQE